MTAGAGMTRSLLRGAALDQTGDLLAVGERAYAHHLRQVSGNQVHHLRGHRRHCDLDPHAPVEATALEDVGRQVALRKRLQQSGQKAGRSVRRNVITDGRKLTHKGPWFG